ncbi:MAG: hypothetical protein LBN97_01130 [Oscillospiraceae bacterium]|jgi:hypothetical protein|nr:hypothetical protein [Oscillospiraceae bacterium]
MSNAKAPKAGLQTKHIVLILGIVVVIAAAAVAVILLTRDKAPEVASSGSVIPVIDESNAEEITSQINQKVADGMFTTYMSTTWTFPDGKSPASDATMGNDPSNHYPFWFTLTVNDEEVYKSSLLPVGMVMKEIKLSKVLEAGTHNAVMMINMVDNDGNPLPSDVGFNITLVIQK